MRLILILFLIAGTANAQQAKVNWKKMKVLVYTKNGKGYVHDNIPSAVKCFQKLGEQNGFGTDVSENPNVFTEENLKQYAVFDFYQHQQRCI